MTDKQIDYEANLNVKAFESTEKMLDDINGFAMRVENNKVVLNEQDIEDLRVEVLHLQTIVRHQ